MKYKKYSYLIVFLLMLVIGINGVNAAAKKKTCYYMSQAKEEFNASLVLHWGDDPNQGGWDLGINSIENFAEVYVDVVSGEFQHDSEPLLNWIKSFIGAEDEPDASGSPELGYFYPNEATVESLTSEPKCPEYLIFEFNSNWEFIPDSYNVFGTNDLNLAKASVAAAEATDDKTTFYATYKNPQGNTITAEEYYGSFSEMGLIDMGNFAEMKLKCEDLFGDADDPNSLHSMINTIMDYVRILVPILIILLGTVDLAKAVIAGKEDNMRKAQWDFAKRVLIGVAIFFVPLLVDVIMELATYAWQGKDYSICQIIK